MRFNKLSSSELLSKSPGNLLRNFLRHVLEMKSGEELQQRVYDAVLRKSIEYNYNYYDVPALTLLNNTEIKTDPSPLLHCISASGVPLNNINEIQASLNRIREKDWEAFNIQTLTGSVLQVQVVGRYCNVAYSPRIYEMLQSSRLTSFR